MSPGTRASTNRSRCWSSNCRPRWTSTCSVPGCCASRAVADSRANCTARCSNARVSTPRRPRAGRGCTTRPRVTRKGSAGASRPAWRAARAAPRGNCWRSYAASIAGEMRARCGTSNASPERREAAAGSFDVDVCADSLAGLQLTLQLDPLAEILEVAFRGGLLLRGHGRGPVADTCVRIETLGARAFHGELGAVATSRRLLDAERRALQRYPCISRVDPFHARVTTIVVHDL